jgi:hypothetical protein
MRIRALSVFEGIVYHCFAVDTSNPCRPVLEVDALLRPGDADAGPLLVSVADYATMVGADVASACLPELERRGRIEDRMGVKHLVFRTWEPAGDIEVRE